MQQSWFSTVISCVFETCWTGLWVCMGLIILIFRVRANLICLPFRHFSIMGVLMIKNLTIYTGEHFRYHLYIHNRFIIITKKITFYFWNICTVKKRMCQNTLWKCQNSLPWISCVLTHLAWFLTHSGFMNT